MKNTQNEKILQIKTLVVGIDIGKDMYYARAFDNRGIELAKLLRFSNTASGYETLEVWMQTIMQQRHEMEQLMQELLLRVLHAVNLLEIKGIGMVLAVVITSEFGDIHRFEDPRQILKMAGLSLKKTVLPSTRAKPRSVNEVANGCEKACFGL